MQQFVARFEDELPGAAAVLCGPPHLLENGDVDLDFVGLVMTNAVQVSHAMSQAAPVRLWLLSDGAQLVILVWDASPQPPVRLDAGDDAENGRGLLLVDAVSTDWGWQFPPDMGGKTVWALLG